jgi:hypothetical protein
MDKLFALFKPKEENIVQPAMAVPPPPVIEQPKVEEKNGILSLLAARPAPPPPVVQKAQPPQLLVNKPNIVIPKEPARAILVSHHSMNTGIRRSNIKELDKREDKALVAVGKAKEELHSIKHTVRSSLEEAVRKEKKRQESLIKKAEDKIAKAEERLRLIRDKRHIEKVETHLPTGGRKSKHNKK